MKRLIAIAYLLFFVPVVLSPAIPFIWAELHQVKVFSAAPEDDCEHDNPQSKMANNGDMYLQALLKRFCNPKKKQTPQNIPSSQIPVFVQKLVGEFPVPQLLTLAQRVKVSDFLPIHYRFDPDFSIFHPPSVA